MLVKVTAVDERREQGGALADDSAFGRALVDELGILAGGDGELRRDQADARKVLAHDVFRRFFHDADDLIIKAGAQAVGEGGNGIAGDGGTLDAVLAEEAKHIAAQIEDLVGSFVAVRAVGTVTEINNVFTGQDAL